MAKLFYKEVGGTDLEVYDDPQLLNKADMQTKISASQEIKNLTDATKTALAAGGVPGLGIPAFGGSGLALQDFDDYIDEDLERLKDLCDYFDYETAPATIMGTASGSWVTPISVITASAELSGSEAILSIDEENGTWWESQETGSHSITFQVKDYKKRFVGLRLRTTSGDLRAQLQGVDIRAAAGLNGLDNAEALIESDVDFTYSGSVWMEHTFASKKTGRYIRLDISGSLNGNNHARIREIDIRTGIINHNK